MAVIPAPPHPIIDYPEPSLDGRVLWLTDEALAEEIAVGGLSIGAPEVLAGVALAGLTYSVADWLFPQTAATYNTGVNWYDRIVNLRNKLKSPAFSGITQWVTASVTDGLYSRDPELTKMLLALAHATHDFTVELGHYADTNAQAMHHLRYYTLPREIQYELRPVRKRVNTIWGDIEAWNSIAKRAGYKNFRTMLRVWVPVIREVRTAERYVRTQKHKDLRGALSTFQTTTNTINEAERVLRKLKIGTITRFITRVNTDLWNPRTGLKVRVGKLEVWKTKAAKTLKPLLELAPSDMSFLAGLAVPAIFARRVLALITDNCDKTTDCGIDKTTRGNWLKWAKDLLQLVLFGALDAIVLGDLCNIAALVTDAMNAVKPALRDIAVVDGGLANLGCAGKTQEVPKPLY